MQTDQTQSIVRLLYLLILDLIIVLGLVFLNQRGAISLYPSILLSVVLLFIVNIAVIWSLTRKLKVALAKASPVSSSLWVAAAVFTPAGTIAILNFILKPNTTHAVQAASGIMLIGYIWYVIYRLFQSRERQVPK
jgi:hypothetical protein